jgi:vancomycin permeability regulator SanA
MSLKKLNIVVVVILSLIAVSFLFVLTVNVIVLKSASDNIIAEDIMSSSVEAIVVLGAGIRADGTPSDMLADRLSVAIKLYEKGLSNCIVLSGDRSGDDYDEVSAMFDYCIERGIPESAIVRDNSGYSTYESVYNVIYSLGYKKIIVVTQKYHLYRAVYISEKMGADVIGVASDPRAYRGQAFRSLREYAARIKDFIKVEISQ